LTDPGGIRTAPGGIQAAPNGSGRLLVGPEFSAGAKVSYRHFDTSAQKSGSDVSQVQSVLTPQLVGEVSSYQLKLTWSVDVFT